MRENKVRQVLGVAMVIGATPKHDLKRRNMNFVKMDAVGSPLMLC